MLSRVADSVYWLSRYMERAENYARFLEVNFNLSLDLPPGVSEQWEPLIAATGDIELYKASYKDFSRENAIYFLGFDHENANSIISSVKYARENARIIRENISREIWEAINGLYYYVNNAEKRKVWQKDDPQNFFSNVKSRVDLIYGIGYSTAVRVEGWYFNEIGLFLERADKTSRILDVKYHMLLPSATDVGSPIDYLHWAALLKSVSGYNAYRRYYGKIDPVNVVDYLVLNRYFPRSIFYCINQAEYGLSRISLRPDNNANYSKLEKAFGSLRSSLEYADVNDIVSYGLHEYLDELQVKIDRISDLIYEQYFKIKPILVTNNQSQ